ncbi:MAG: BglII/BstYI family type II restriction endonuclease [Dehalococcoidia bacterium]
MKTIFLDYRFAEAVLDDPRFEGAKGEIVSVLQEASVPLLDCTQLDARRGGVKRRERRALAGDTTKRYFYLPVDQKQLNRDLEAAFVVKGWATKPPIVPPGRSGGPGTGLRGDFKKGRLHVEVQFGNMARWYTDVFKFQLSYSLDEIDAGVLVVPTQRFANVIDENVAYFERVQRELPWAKMSLTLPIWVIGVEPEDDSPIRQCYEQAARLFEGSQTAEPIASISYGDRVAEIPASLPEEDPAAPLAD